MRQLREKILDAYQIYQSARIFKDPDDLERVIALADLTLQRAKPGDVENIFNGIKWTPMGVTAVETRMRIKIPLLVELLQMPGDSLGYAMGAFLKKHGIDPADITTPEIKDDLTYLAAHLAETHDIWHVLTDFNPDLTGEAGVAAFSAAQTNSPFQMAIVSGVLLKALTQDPWHMQDIMQAVSRGWQLGQKMTSLIGIDWSNHWLQPLIEVRRELGMV